MIDTHHHLYQRKSIRYLLDEYLEDIAGPHDIRASVMVQARAMLRADGPVELQTLGEAEFANGMAAMSASGIYGPCRVAAAFVAHADLMLGSRVREVLEKLVMASGGTTREGGRLSGIRQPLCWDSDTTLLNPAYPTTANMIESPDFIAGFAELASFGLNFESWAFFHQLGDIARLARAFPETQFVINHCGGIVRVGNYSDPDAIDGIWRKGIQEAASCPNITMKLSGLGLELSGFGFAEAADPPSSADLAKAWKPWMDHCLESFGADRCMWGSNFPVDKGSYALGIGLNAVKRLCAGASEDEKDAIFWRNALRIYGLPAASVGLSSGV